MRRVISAILLFFVFTAFALANDSTTTVSAIPTDDHGDPVLKAMIAELKRSQEKLQLGQMQRPYYIDYQVTELQDSTADATLGALRTNQVNVGRLVRVVVRIGDYKQDSYFGEGTGAVEVMPTDDQELALRRQLWLATDKAYKAALTGFTEKQAALKNVETENDLVDFSQE
ncbi:MAG TPA: peptidase U62, partial [Candidatus Angelobacter sp.]|nr:peptidase U62 [Candidatus Angelobacter sp.]